MSILTMADDDEDNTRDHQQHTAEATALQCASDSRHDLRSPSYYKENV
jgi:hypothetical protein